MGEEKRRRRKKAGERRRRRRRRTLMNGRKIKTKNEPKEKGKEKEELSRVARWAVPPPKIHLGLSQVLVGGEILLPHRPQNLAVWGFFRKF